MPTPRKVDVELTLAQHDRAAKLEQAVRDAWDQVSDNPDIAWWRRKSTRAANLWEYAVRNMIAALADDPGLRIEPHHDTVSFIFDDAVLLRFKKGDVGFYSRNVETQLALAFHQHDNDLFGYRGLQRVELIYVLTRLETAIDWVGAVAREKRRVLWSLPLQDVGGAPMVTPLPLPEPASPADQVKLKPEIEAEIEGDKKKPDDEVAG